MKQSELRQLIRKLITEDDSTESYLAPSRFTFEPNDNGIILDIKTHLMKGY